MLLSLIAMNYHFVGDVVAGTTLGALVAVWATRLSAQATMKNFDRITGFAGSTG
jgi:membrane-associated phospholipid phosphatase